MELSHVFASIVDEAAITRFWACIDCESHPHGCWVWTKALGDGYGNFGIKGRVYRSHRFSWQLTHGEIPNGLCVLHRCDNRACVRVDHLWLGTRKENNADRDAKKRNHSKLTFEIAQQIRLEYVPGVVTQEDLAKKYGVGNIEISCIITGKHWTNGGKCIVPKFPRIGPRGERAGGVKLTWEKVREIRRIYAEEKLGYGTIAKQYGLDRTTISNVIQQKSWKE